jgi:alpha-L-fucosidase
MAFLYEPTLESLKQHTLPNWFRDAKLGIMISWGLYSIPAWAVPCGPQPEVARKKGYRYVYRNNPYAEFYWNTLKIKDSPTRQFHFQTYGEQFAYPDFADQFNVAAERWDPGAWAGLFSRIGARYVVLVTKHHDGFLLWPSRTPNPYRPGFRARRDITGELTEAVRAHGMRMGLYYSGGPDWWFEPRTIANEIDFTQAIPQSAEYVAYVNRHWRELIERYQPSILWNDIGFPVGLDVKALYADYYNQNLDGVVNDRSLQADVRKLAASAPGRLFIRLLLRLAMKSLSSGKPFEGIHADFRTPEYETVSHLTNIKWETTRGLGYSFGYNQNETAEHMLSVEQLVHMLADTVSKNGNLLLCIGPKADGSIPDLQQERINGLGDWLAANGEAIYDTHPWTMAETKTDGGTPVRFTAKGDCLYAILLGTPTQREVRLPALRFDPVSTISLLGEAAALNFAWSDGQAAIHLPELSTKSPAHTLKIFPIPEIRA